MKIAENVLQANGNTSLVKFNNMVPSDCATVLVKCRRLVRDEGLFAGISSGANVAAAIKIAKRLKHNVIVIILLIDSGLKYLSGDLDK